MTHFFSKVQNHRMNASVSEICAGGKQAPVVCENTAGRGSPSDAFADRGQARLQVAPISSLSNLGRAGGVKAARPVFWGPCRRTANRSAAQQVIPSLLIVPLGSGCPQKSVCFCFGIGVFFPFKHFTDAVCVGSEFVNDVGKSDTLHTHNVGCNSLCECECTSLFGDNVQNDPRNWVSFGWGFSPKKISHGWSSVVAGRIAMGVSGISPAVLWCRAVCKGAVSLAGVATANRRPGTLIQSHVWQIWISGNPVDNLGVVVGKLGRFCGLRLLAVSQ